MIQNSVLIVPFYYPFILTQLSVVFSVWIFIELLTKTTGRAKVLYLYFSNMHGRFCELCIYRSDVCEKVCVMSVSDHLACHQTLHYRHEINEKPN